MSYEEWKTELGELDSVLRDAIFLAILVVGVVSLRSDEREDEEVVREDAPDEVRFGQEIYGIARKIANDLKESEILSLMRG